MVFSMLPNQLVSSHPWGIPLSAILPPNPTKSLSCGFVCPPARHAAVAMTPLPGIKSTSTTSTSSSNTIAVASKSKLQSTNKKYSAEWMDLLSPDSYSSSSSSSIPLPNKINPPRSGAVSVSDNDQLTLVTFGGYAEVASTSDSMPPERFVVNDVWKFVPYEESESNNISQESSSSSWGWNKVLQNEKEEYIPGPRLATALAVLPSSKSNGSKKNNAVLLGGWDPQTAGTGGVILEDVSMLDMDSLEWSQCTSTTTNDDGDEGNNNQVTIPGGPTSRHVAVPLSIQSNDDDNDNDVRHVICLHNHRCNDHVLLFSASSKEGSMCDAKWEHQPTTGNVPSSRGLHCATSLAYGPNDDDNDADTSTKAMVIFGGAAKDGSMSNEVFVLDVRSWKWTRLDCSSSAGDDDADAAHTDIPTPRAGACLCPLDENSVLLFGGAMPATAEEGGGLLGLNDVWVLHVDMEHGKGKWECLIRNQSVVDNDNDGDVVRPPGRNAATLCAIDAGKLLPNMNAGTEGDGKVSCFLLQGGWYPFRKTYDDVFLLCINSSD